jgi:hypothetical protein
MLSDDSTNEGGWSLGLKAVAVRGTDVVFAVLF